MHFELEDRMAAKEQNTVLVRTMKAVAPKGFKRQGSGELLATKAGITRKAAKDAVVRAIENLPERDLRLLRGIQIIALM
jgi:hypothetical protein